MTGWAAARRRVILVPVVAQLAWRGWVLAMQPFANTVVPGVVWGSFLCAAVVLAALVFWPNPWTETLYGLGAVAAGAPYLAYVGWLITARELSGIILATIGDLLLIVWLVGGTWGRVPVKRND